ncbi:hypothetical protein Sa4125_35820 [Aureimonas sp. SA4125]|uniref:hypothetical protein n=1 Tax=Aureimonas sp. SA4125 TaxID=2826993 RepID=UPI001CC5C53E|nr:hypothetical protein [Aureimonas sp. SA4125]BDA86040.1 hypothetical protein Sa4125_35820 [Aureimonas sp. SA4125]
MSDTIIDRSTVLATPVVQQGPLRRISWGAIFAGAILTLVVQVMLGLLGLGIGMATIDPASNGSPDLSAIGSASGLWTLGTVLIATFFGAWAAARLAGSPEKADGVLHGLVTWATSTLVAVYLLTSGASALIGGTFGALGGSISALTSAAGNLGPNSLSALPDGIEGQARQLLQRREQQVDQAANAAVQQGQQAADTARQTTGEADLGEAIPEIVAGLGEGATPEQRQAAITVISQQAGISPQEAEQRLNDFQATYDRAVEEAKVAADAAAETVSTASFAGFIALLLGLIVAAIGGMVGRPHYRARAVAV